MLRKSTDKKKTKIIDSNLLTLNTVNRLLCETFVQYSGKFLHENEIVFVLEFLRQKFLQTILFWPPFCFKTGMSVFIFQYSSFIAKVINNNTYVKKQ